MKKKGFTSVFPELLYFSIGEQIGTLPHFHSFYQLEVCIEGEFVVKKPGSAIRLSPGDYGLIPPEMIHSFSSRGQIKFFSLKFNFNSAVPDIQLRDGEVQYHLDAIRRVISNQADFSPFSPTGKAIIEAHLYDFLHCLANARENAVTKPESQFIMQLKEEICRRGYRINVGELAEFCQCSRSQFKYRFQKESQWKSSIKKFIEHVLFDVAQKHLLYSGMSLTKIAEIMHFPGISLFSRFIKNQTGLSPSEYRKKIRERAHELELD